MKNNDQPKLTNMTIREFAKLEQLEKIYLLKNMATLIDIYMDNGNLLHIYAISDFFVEATIHPVSEMIIDIIPYRRGFLMNKDYLINHLRQNLFSCMQAALTIGC